jgi:hypothetical protein
MRPFVPTPYLAASEYDLRTRGSYEGMASFAGTGPNGSHCGSCLYWGMKRYWVDGESHLGYSRPHYVDMNIQPRRCFRAWQMQGERPRHGVPFHAAGCSQWKPNPDPPDYSRRTDEDASAEV